MVGQCQSQGVALLGEGTAMQHYARQENSRGLSMKRARRRTLAAVGGATGVFALALTLVWQSPAFAAAPVNLGTAGSFSVLAGATVTNTGLTTLEGDLGVSPGTATTGFPPGIVGGTVHAADATALGAQSDLTAAYDEAADLALTASVSGDLVGRTLPAGVYKSTGPLAVSGSLTLDGQGNPDSVFIFQIASTLTTATSSNIILTNNAQACNVYWQVGSSATLGTASSFTGTVLALRSITVTTGARVEGRVLARNGQVSLDTNAFTAPGCAGNPPPTTAPVTPTPTQTTTATPPAADTPTATQTATPTASATRTATQTATATPPATDTPTATQTA
ncbi:MAG: hypothetical protein JWN19_2100, partial [Arthrobacter sp.]|nr:hypothetical protein [Arthrobacter sp.]